MATFKKFKTAGLIVLLLFTLTDGYLWYEIFSKKPATAPRHYEWTGKGGTSQLFVLQGGANVLIDAGGVAGGTATSSSLDAALGGATYIDIAVIGNMEEASWDGFSAMMDHYSFGAFLYNGREPATGEWRAFLSKVRAKHIPLVTIGAGDSIHYAGNTIDFLSPDTEFAHSPDPKDAGLVEHITNSAFQMLITADVGKNVEDFLAEPAR
jgi:beta-lactamase superfamily II metal-dependent hydrolase